MGTPALPLLAVFWGSQLGSAGLRFALSRLGTTVGPASSVATGMENMDVKYLEHRT